MSQSFEDPPCGWIADVDTIDESVGIYLWPSSLVDAPNPVFWHWCTKAPSGPRWFAMRTPLHTVESVNPWTLSPSLLCDYCGLHGFIRQGRWIPAS